MPFLPPRARAVITAYFEEKGLVRQQLDSFNDFINTSLQEIVDENKLIVITPQSQHVPGAQVEDDIERRFEVSWQPMRSARRIEGLAQPRCCGTNGHCGSSAGELGAGVAVQVEFSQIYLSKPVFVEADGETAVLFPKEARLRNLTYSAPLYVDVERRDKVRGPVCLVVPRALVAARFVR